MRGLGVFGAGAGHCGMGVLGALATSSDETGREGVGMLPELITASDLEGTTKFIPTEGCTAGGTLAEFVGVISTWGRSCSASSPDSSAD
jgi:hypothetical protein